MARSENTFQNILFKPSTLRSLKDGSTRIDNITLAGTNKEQSDGTRSLTGSFRYDPAGAPLKSTQQLNVDFSKFENHTFLNSAEMKVQTAFDRIVNHYPFDGTKAEYITFHDSLSGFDKWVLSQFPTHKGFLNFVRQDSEGAINNYLSVNDLAGVSQLTAGQAGTGAFVLDFSNRPFTVEMQLYVPSGTINDNEVIFQKISGSTKGLTIALSASSPDGTSSSPWSKNRSPLGEVSVATIFSSGSSAISASVSVTKGEFHHFASVYDRNGTGKISLYVDGVLTSTSSTGYFGSLGIETSPITIGSGTQHSVPLLGEVFTPPQQLSGALDELRVFHSKRSLTQLKSFSNRSIFSPEDKSLKLYFKFNEPSGSFGTTSKSGNESLVLDHSGNGLHSNILMGSGGAFDMSLRNTGSLNSPMTAESRSKSPVLFPSFEGVTNLGVDLLNSASDYDHNNPNLVTRLIPKHYLLEANEVEGFTSEQGDIAENYGYSSDIPGGGRMQSAQIIASMFYLWSETFDEIKMFVDEFGRLLKVDYLSPDTISDQLLPFLAKYYGLSLPNAYANANMRQFQEGEDLNLNKVSSNLGLQGIQNTIWRRVLTDLPELLKTRGTKHSIEAIFRNMGINPDGAFRIREYGGSRTKNISDSYEKRREMAAMLSFSGSFFPQGDIDGSGRDSNRPLIQGSFLSGSRIEPGVPLPRGTFVNGISNNQNDGLFTSGSWSVEGLFKFDQALKHPVTQSLLRIQSTGSQTDGSSNNILMFNAVATKTDILKVMTGSLTLLGRPVGVASAPTLRLHLTGVDIFDGNKWHITYGRTRNDQAASYTSSSYFFRAGRMGFNKIDEFYEAEGWFDDSSLSYNNLNLIGGQTNASGSFIAIGSQSLLYDDTAGRFLNSYSDVLANYVDFTGKVSGVRFFTKALTQKETLTHVRNFKSLGVENPLINFNFNTADSGSFERMRVNTSCDQPVTKSNGAGQIQIFDFSQNLLHASGTGFQNNSQVVEPERFDYMILSPRFELATDPNKIRIRSFQHIENIRSAAGSDGVSFAPMFKIPENEQPKDDRRLSVEVSAVQALNEDIINIFATLDSMDNIIGDPQLVFAQNYPDLRHLRRIYFNRLEDKVSLTKFFQFFKWFDQAVGGLIEEMIPSTTRYLGTNFVVESHALERNKFTYNYSDMYVGIIDRREASVIFMQQFVGSLRKF